MHGGKHIASCSEQNVGRIGDGDHDLAEAMSPAPYHPIHYHSYGIFVFDSFSSSRRSGGLHKT
jgi:hypothetical protein